MLKTGLHRTTPYSPNGGPIIEGKAVLRFRTSLLLAFQDVCLYITSVSFLPSSGFRLRYPSAKLQALGSRGTLTILHRRCFCCSKAQANQHPHLRLCCLGKSSPQTRRSRPEESRTTRQGSTCIRRFERRWQRLAGRHDALCAVGEAHRVDGNF